MHPERDQAMACYYEDLQARMARGFAAVRKRLRETAASQPEFPPNPAIPVETWNGTQTDELQEILEDVLVRARRAYLTALVALGLTALLLAGFAWWSARALSEHTPTAFQIDMMQRGYRDYLEEQEANRVSERQ